jgi:hypothetical protein
VVSGAETGSLKGTFAVVWSRAPAIGAADLVIGATGFAGEVMRIASITPVTHAGAGPTNSALAETAIAAAAGGALIGRVAARGFIERVSHADQTFATIGVRIAFVIPLGAGIGAIAK